MSDTPSPVDALKRTPVVIAVVVAVIVVLVWLLAFFLPQGNKASTLDTQEQTLQQQMAQGNAKVARLEHTFRDKPQLSSMTATLQTDVPATSDIYNYVDSLSATAAAAQVKLTSVTPGSATAPSSSSGSGLSTILITMSVKGTYDHLLSLITKIYALPRLTDIDSLTIGGGGTGTNRSTTLTATLSLMVFTTAKPAATSP